MFPKKLILPLFLLLCAKSVAQKDFFQDIPCYKKMLLDFYAEYAPEQYFSFVKKSGGWHISYTDSSDEMVNVLYRPCGVDFYNPLPFAKRSIRLETGAVEALSEYQNLLCDLYTMERHAYYGYSNWASDVIKDYESKENLSEWEIESLARAYDVYASVFVSITKYGNTVTNKDSIFQSQIDSFLYYSDKAISQFSNLAKKNRAYITKVGTIDIKLSNEYANVYFTLKLCGNHKKALDYLQKCQYSPNVIIAAQNYLDGLPPNSILFTNADNDSYPLWYVQQIKNFRKDVSVINITLLDNPLFLKMIINDLSAPVKLEKVFTEINTTYFLRDKNTVYEHDSFPVRNILDYRKYNKDSIPLYMTAKYYILSPAGKKLSLVPDEPYHLSRLLILYQLIESNIPDRPVLFTQYESMSQPLQGYARVNGINFEVNFDDNNRSNTPSVSYFFNNHLSSFVNDSLYLSHKNDMLMTSYKHYINVVTDAVYNIHYTNPGDVEAVDELISRLKSIWPNNELHYHDQLFALLDILYSGAYLKQARELRIFLQTSLKKRKPVLINESEIWFYNDIWLGNNISYLIEECANSPSLELYPEEKNSWLQFLKKIEKH